MPNLYRLPLALIESYEWQYEGACAELDPETFFSPEYERGAKRTAREDRAKQICARCPVIERCLQHALDAQEPYGVWGGKTAGERQRLTQHPIAA